MKLNGNLTLVGVLMLTVLSSVCTSIVSASDSKTFDVVETVEIYEQLEGKVLNQSDLQENDITILDSDINVEEYIKLITENKQLNNMNRNGPSVITVRVKRHYPILKYAPKTIYYNSDGYYGYIPMTFSEPGIYGVGWDVYYFGAVFKKGPGAY